MDCVRPLPMDRRRSIIYRQPPEWVRWYDRMMWCSSIVVNLIFVFLLFLPILRHGAANWPASSRLIWNNAVWNMTFAVQLMVLQWPAKIWPKPVQPAHSILKNKPLTLRWALGSPKSKIAIRMTLPSLMDRNCKWQWNEWLNELRV